jgi:pSer/pThr/pTyr-binding forkhead associated (FHA) protein
MQLSLVVQTAGSRNAGQVIPIKLPVFLVGRDPQCHLRPASPMISKRHCALIQREGKFFVRDFDSTNGTQVNDEAVKGEREIHNGDRLKIGPIAFAVRIEAGVAVSRPTPPPPTKVPAAGKTPAPASKPAAGPPKPGQPKAPSAPTPAAPTASTPAPATSAPVSGGSANEDDIIALLMSGQDLGGGTPDVSGADIPEGSTVMDLRVPGAPGEAPAEGEQAKEKEKEKEKAKGTLGNTQSAAKSILEKMMRRPRT